MLPCFPITFTSFLFISCLPLILVPFLPLLPCFPITFTSFLFISCLPLILHLTFFQPKSLPCCISGITQPECWNDQECYIYQFPSTVFYFVFNMIKINISVFTFCIEHILILCYIIFIPHAMRKLYHLLTSVFLAYIYIYIICLHVFMYLIAIFFAVIILCTRWCARWFHFLVLLLKSGVIHA